MPDSSSLIIRHATYSDLEICLHFETTDPTSHSNHDEVTACVASRIGTKDIVLAFDQDIPVGYMRVDKLWTMQKPLISWMFVAPSHRGRTVLAQLYAFLLAHLRSRGYTQLLCSAQSDRPYVIRWMERHKMYPCGQLKKINNDKNIDEIFFAIDL